MTQHSLSDAQLDFIASGVVDKIGNGKFGDFGWTSTNVKRRIGPQREQRHLAPNKPGLFSALSLVLTLLFTMLLEFAIVLGDLVLVADMDYANYAVVDRLFSDSRKNTQVKGVKDGERDCRLTRAHTRGSRDTHYRWSHPNSLPGGSPLLKRKKPFARSTLISMRSKGSSDHLIASLTCVFLLSL